MRCLLLLFALLTACGPAVIPSAAPNVSTPAVTPTILPSTPTAYPPTPTLLRSPTFTAAIPSSTPARPASTQTTAPLAPMPTAAATTTPRAGWHIYDNRYLGYTIQYPPGIKVENIDAFGMDQKEPVPPGFSDGGYFDYVRKILPKNLCVIFSNQYGSLTIGPPAQWVGRFEMPCPGIGPGEGYRFEDATLTARIGGQDYTAAGTRLVREATGLFDSEFYGFALPNGFGIVYLGGSTAGMSEAAYLEGRAALLRMLETLAWTRVPDMTLPGWTCAGAFTRLLPGTYATVKADNDIPNRVRSEPKKGDNVITEIYPGAPFEVLEGPVCADGLVFWKIRHSTIPGGTGWTAEGDGTDYYLERYSGE